MTSLLNLSLKLPKNESLKFFCVRMEREKWPKMKVFLADLFRAVVSKYELSSSCVSNVYTFFLWFIDARAIHGLCVCKRERKKDPNEKDRQRH